MCNNIRNILDNTNYSIDKLANYIIDKCKCEECQEIDRKKKALIIIIGFFKLRLHRYKKYQSKILRLINDNNNTEYNTRIIIRDIYLDN
jgi:hypothetical protein